MMNEQMFNNHFIVIDAQARIIDCWSDGPEPNRDTGGAILLTDQGGYQFRLFPDGPENPWDEMFTEDRIPKYKWDGTRPVKRTQAEIEADRPEPKPPEPTMQEQIDLLKLSMTAVIETMTASGAINTDSIPASVKAAFVVKK